MSRKRVAFVCTNHARGGLELNHVKLAGWMAEAGHTIHYVAAEGAPLVDEAQSRGLPLMSLRRRSRYLDLPAAWRLARWTAELGIDALVVSTTWDIDLAVFARKLSGNRLRVVYLQQMPLGFKRDPIHTWKYRNLAAWVAPLPYLRDMALERTRMPAERMHVVPLCIETARFTENPTTPEEARAGLKLPGDALVYGLVGRFDEQKGQHVALDAFESMAGDVPQAHLLFVGEPTLGEGAAYSEELVRRIDASPFRERIHVRPFIDRVEDVYRALDVFLMASKAEPFGMVTVEAMASGCAVIGTRAGGTVDLLGGGEFGVLCEPEDAGSLGAAMREMAGSVDLRSGLAARGVTEARDRYGKGVQVVRLGEILAASSMSD